MMSVDARLKCILNPLTHLSSVRVRSRRARVRGQRRFDRGGRGGLGAVRSIPSTGARSELMRTPLTLPFLSGLLPSFRHGSGFDSRWIPILATAAAAAVAALLGGIINTVFGLAFHTPLGIIFDALVAGIAAMGLKIVMNVGWEFLAGKYDMDDISVRLAVVFIYVLGKFCWGFLAALIMSKVRGKKVQMIKGMFVSVSSVISSIVEAALLKIIREKKEYYRRKNLGFETVECKDFPAKYMCIECVVSGVVYGIFNSLSGIVLTGLFCKFGIYKQEEGDCLTFLVCVFILFKNAITGVVYNFVSYYVKLVLEQYQKDKNEGEGKSSMDVEVNNVNPTPDVTLVASVADVAK